MHVPVQADSQQTPSTQKPLVQSESQAQASPLVFAAPPAHVTGVGAASGRDELIFVPPQATSAWRGTSHPKVSQRRAE
jgi:hypothetical protein